MPLCYARGVEPIARVVEAASEVKGREASGNLVDGIEKPALCLTGYPHLMSQIRTARSPPLSARPEGPVWVDCRALGNTIAFVASGLSTTGKSTHDPQVASGMLRV